MAFSTSLRDGTALLALSSMQLLNRTLTFRNTITDTPVTLFCTWDDVTSSGQEFNRTGAQKKRMKFYIPRQTAFPPAGGIRRNAQIGVDLGEGAGTENFHVTETDDGGVGALYELNAEREIPLRLTA